mmetsp:Transcript_11049/g.47182  ORF Transcript_11049/g.47182 Transcript_11049/m.47182 type:complete len:229 (+) Transcript_11049:2241-2927(+)
MRLHVEKVLVCVVPQTLRRDVQGPALVKRRRARERHLGVRAIKRREGAEIDQEGDAHYYVRGDEEPGRAPAALVRGVAALVARPAAAPRLAAPVAPRALVRPGRDARHRGRREVHRGGVHGDRHRGRGERAAVRGAAGRVRRGVVHRARGGHGGRRRGVVRGRRDGRRGRRKIRVVRRGRSGGRVGRGRTGRKRVVVHLLVRVPGGGPGTGGVDAHGVPRLRGKCRPG